MEAVKPIVRFAAAAVAVMILSGSYAVTAGSKTAPTPVAAGAPAAPAATSSPGVPATPTPEQPAAEKPQPAPPPQVIGEEHDFSAAAGKAIEISIEKQELVAWEEGRVVFRFPISTGRDGYKTPTGTFRVHTKYEKRWSRKWKVWMPYAMFWHPKHGYALHELPYKSNPDKRIGASKLGRRDSHGCVRINVGDAQELYEWAPVGTTVWIH